MSLPTVSHSCDPASSAAALEQRVAELERLRHGAQTRDAEGIVFSIHSAREWERFKKPADAATLAWLRGMRPGEVLYDVGANTGLFSLKAAVMHVGAVRVHAFEPAFGTYESLVRNLIANDLLDTVTPWQVGLSDTTRMDILNYTSAEAGAALHAVGEPIDYKRESFQPTLRQRIPVYALDDLIRLFALPPPTFLKIDVDGIEVRVLSGAAGTLRHEALRSVQVEVVETCAEEPNTAAIRHALETAGLRLEHESAPRRPRREAFPVIFDLTYTRPAR